MGRKRSFAIVRSNNTVRFAFPYGRDQHGTLMIRRTPQWGTDVILEIERGQFLCGLDQCNVNVLFDSGHIQHFTASEPTDHSTTVLFIRGQDRFISQLRKAKTVRIEATFYQEGNQAFIFNVEALKWKDAEKKRPTAEESTPDEVSK